MTESMTSQTASVDCDVGERAPSDLPFPPEFYAQIDGEVPPPIPEGEVALKVSFYALAMALGIAGNMAMLLIVVGSKRMHTMTNIYMANLAASDLMVTCLCMWVHMGLHITPEWPFGAAICVTNSFVLALSATASVFFLTVISVDRFFAIVYPLRARARTGRRWQVLLIVTVTWLAAGASALPHVFSRRLVEIIWRNRHEIFCEENWPRYWFLTDYGFCLTHQPGRKIYLTIQVILLYGVPVMIMCAAYAMIVATLWKRQPPGEQCDNQTLVQQRSRKKCKEDI